VSEIASNSGALPNIHKNVSGRLTDQEDIADDRISTAGHRPR
jgi:hypothetical protein